VRFKVLRNYVFFKEDLANGFENLKIDVKWKNLATMLLNTKKKTWAPAGKRLLEKMFT